MLVKSINQEEIVILNNSLYWLMKIQFLDIYLTWVVWGMKGEVGGENRNVGDNCWG